MLSFLFDATPALAARRQNRFAKAKFPRVSGNPSPRDADLRMGGGRSQGANFSLRRFLIRNHLLNCLEHRPELLVITLLQLRNLTG